MGNTVQQCYWHVCYMLYVIGTYVLLASVVFIPAVEQEIPPKKGGGQNVQCLLNLLLYEILSIS